MPQNIQHNANSGSDSISNNFSYVLMQSAVKPVSWQSELLATFPVLETTTNLPPLPFKPKPDYSGFPLFYIYLSIVVIWGLFYKKNFKTLKNIPQSFVSNIALHQLLNERKSFNGFVSIGMFLLGLITLSIFSFQAIQNVFPEFAANKFNDSKSYIFLILAALISSTFFKSLILGISSWIFNQPSSLTGYLSLNVNSIQILGIGLLPLTILYSYSYHLNPLWIVGLGGALIILTFIYRLNRTFFLALKETNSQVFHIILYICALEILPLLVVGKLVFS